MPIINLFIWRHADAVDGSPDMARQLSPRGHRDASRVAKALAKKLDEKSCIVSSPALRARETVEPLIARMAVELGIDERLAPGADIDDVLGVLEDTITRCNDQDPTIVMVGHQPWVGQLARRLLTDARGDWSVKKASAWWLVRRSRDGSTEWTLRSVLDPDLV